MLDAQGSSSIARKHTSNAVWSTCFSILRNEGFRCLYRGIGPPILMEAPKRALKFTVNDTASPVFLQLSGRTVPNLSIAVFSGVTAGETEVFVVAPFEKVKIRMQSPDSASKYASSLDCLKKIIKGEGFLALMKGLHATVFWFVILEDPIISTCSLMRSSQGIWNATYFGTIWSVRSSFSAEQTWRKKTMINLLAGSTGGFLATISGNPFDVIKSRVQKLELARHERAPHPSSVLTKIAREEGYSSWYRGFRAKAMRLTPGGGILLVIFEQAKAML